MSNNPVLRLGPLLLHLHEELLKLANRSSCLLQLALSLYQLARRLLSVRATDLRRRR